MGSKITNGLAWSYAERILAQAVSFIVSIVLARLIAPEQYGVVSLVLIYINICNVFVTSGLGTGLVQKKDAGEQDFSSVFWVSLALGLVLYGIIFLTSPLIASFYDYEDLSAILRVLGLRIVIASVNSIQHAYVSRKMIFRKFFFSTLFGTVISAVVGIALARHGFGAWALVAQYLTNTLIDTVVLFIVLPWRPKLEFCAQRVRYFVSYGWKIMASSFLDSVFANLRSFIIGSRYSSSDLAYYNKGLQIPNLIVTNANSSLTRVLFPALSRVQESKAQMRLLVRKAVNLSAYLLSPILVGLIIIAKPLITLILTERWLLSVPFLQIFAASYLFMPMHAINAEAIKATGRSDLTLKIEIAKKVVGIALIAVSILFVDTPIAVALSFLAYSLIVLVINALPGKQLYDYGWLLQLLDVLKPLGVSAAMAALTWPLSKLIHSPALLIAAQIAAGAVFYLITTRLLRFEALGILSHKAKSLLHRRK